MRALQKVKENKFKSTEHKHAIILKDRGGTEYIYKSYASEDTLQTGLSRMRDRRIARDSRVAKIKITIEEV